MAEQFGFQQVLGDGRRVERHERLAGARAVLVQGTRHQLLAGTGFAGDEHRDIGLRQAADGAEHVLHRRCLAEDFGSLGCTLLDIGFAQALVERAANQFDRLVDVEGLGQVFEGAALEGGDRRVQIREGGDDDHRDAGVLGLDGLQQFQAGGTGHADVGHQHLRRAVLQGCHRIACAGETLRGEIFSGQGFFEHPAYRFVVVNNPDWLHK